MDVARECIFMGYTETTSQHRLYALYLHKVVVSSYIKFKEHVHGSSILDLKFWKNAGLDFIEGQGNSAPAIRNPVGRPRKSFLSEAPPRIDESTSARRTVFDSNLKIDNLNKMVPMEELSTKNKQVISPALSTINKKDLKIASVEP